MTPLLINVSVVFMENDNTDAVCTEAISVVPVWAIYTLSFFFCFYYGTEMTFEKKILRFVFFLGELLSAIFFILLYFVGCCLETICLFTCPLTLTIQMTRDSNLTKLCLRAYDLLMFIFLLSFVFYKYILTNVSYFPCSSLKHGAKIRIRLSSKKMGVGVSTFPTCKQAWLTTPHWLFHYTCLYIFRAGLHYHKHWNISFVQNVC